MELLPCFSKHSSVLYARKGKVVPESAKSTREEERRGLVLLVPFLVYWNLP